MKPIEKILEEINLHAAYMRFSSVTKHTYLIYYARGADKYIADDSVYHSEYKYPIEYYFNIKSRENEQEIESILNKNEVVWEKSEDIYIDSEDMYLIKYYI